ncbi:DUF4115 domain-containing protein [Cyanobium sp. WAJ14-Wanaka]|uniref:DUF4115 domain-containing protein n=1 Tax=Cyanobium sp. WAJ14-Wanaka TaxID=2823725 RepID=UPI0020CC2525|nr:DUF4115 domain-containing protein [Cyanobium sp. WAJ14-Wanaka]MCP9774287.1 hypothetical protein [Cyanobium sp. WAJ14-Wanaka]
MVAESPRPIQRPGEFGKAEALHPMEPEVGKPEPTSPRDHHHPVPMAFVRLYGLFAVLFVLMPEWMDVLLRQSAKGRIGASWERDREAGGPSLPRPRRLVSLSQPGSRRRSTLASSTLASWVLLIGIGAGLGWGGTVLLGRGRTPSSSEATIASRPQVVSLVLYAAQPSWVEVRSLEGRPIYGAIFQGKKSWRLGEGLEVLAGRPDLVIAAVGNQPARALGRIDQIDWVTFKPGDGRDAGSAR